MSAEVHEPTSETLYGITEQPSPTCPMIDEAIASLRKALKSLSGWKKMDEEQLKDACDYAEWHLSNAEGEMEQVRDHVESVRAWGQQWKDLAKEHAPAPTPEARHE